MGCHFLLQCMKVKSEREVAQSCPTLSDPMDYSLPGSSIHGIFQARVLEWGAIACCNSWGCKESDTTERLNWTELNTVLKSLQLVISILILFYDLTKTVAQNIIKSSICTKSTYFYRFSHQDPGRDFMSLHQIRSVAQACRTLCDPMNHRTPGLPVHHQLPEFTQTQAIKSVILSSHLNLCRPFLLLPPIHPSIRVFSN